MGRSDDGCEWIRSRAGRDETIITTEAPDAKDPLRCIVGVSTWQLKLNDWTFEALRSMAIKQSMISLCSCSSFTLMILISWCIYVMIPKWKSINRRGKLRNLFLLHEMMMSILREMRSWLGRVSSFIFMDPAMKCSVSWLASSPHWYWLQLQCERRKDERRALKTMNNTFEVNWSLFHLEPPSSSHNNYILFSSPSSHFVEARLSFQSSEFHYFHFSQTQFSTDTAAMSLNEALVHVCMWFLYYYRLPSTRTHAEA